MLYYDRIEISDGIDPTNTNRTNHEFKFPDSVCNSCHDLKILISC